MRMADRMSGISEIRITSPWASGEDGEIWPVISIGVGCVVAPAQHRGHIVGTVNVAGAQVPVGYLNAENLWEIGVWVQWDNDPSTAQPLHLVEAGKIRGQTVLAIRGDETQAFVDQLHKRREMRLRFGYAGPVFLLKLTEGHGRLRALEQECKALRGE